MGHAARAVTSAGSNAPAPSKTLTCVEAYSVTLNSSEYYVPEGQQFVPRETPQLSTVVSGMLRDNCGEPLKSVAVHINVHDDSGKAGSGVVTVEDLSPGEAKPFSKAWMGRVTSYEIEKIQ